MNSIIRTTLCMFAVMNMTASSTLAMFGAIFMHDIFLRSEPFYADNRIR